MDNLNKINLIQLTSTEVVNISGGNSILRKLIDYMGGWIAGKAFDEIAEYIADPDRQVEDGNNNYKVPDFKKIRHYSLS